MQKKKKVYIYIHNLCSRMHWQGYLWGRCLEISALFYTAWLLAVIVVRFLWSCSAPCGADSADNIAS